MVNKSQEDALVLLRNTQPGGIVPLVVSRQALKQSAPDNVVMVNLFVYCIDLFKCFECMQVTSL